MLQYFSSGFIFNAVPLSSKGKNYLGYLRVSGLIIKVTLFDTDFSLWHMEVAFIVSYLFNKAVEL